MTTEQIDTLAYFINDWLRLLGHGEEYRKLYAFVNSLYKSGIDFPRGKYAFLDLAIEWGYR